MAIKTQTYADAEHFAMLSALGLSSPHQLKTYRAWQGGVWDAGDGKRTYITPSPDSGLALLAELRADRLEAAAEKAGYDQTTINALVRGDVTAAQLGLDVDLTIKLPDGTVRTL